VWLAVDWTSSKLPLEQPGAIRVEFDSGGQQFGSMEATGSHAATPSVKCSWQHCKITT